MMQVNFTGRNLEVTEALKIYATEKFQKLERRHNYVSIVNLVLQVEHITHIAEAMLHLDGLEIHATAQADDMYKAIDLLIDKLSAQITKYKEKSTDHHR